jgi:hypothetical protein
MWLTNELPFSIGDGPSSTVADCRGQSSVAVTIFSWERGLDLGWEFTFSFWFSFQSSALFLEP